MIGRAAPDDPAIDALRASAGRWQESLSALVAIPGISAPAFPPDEVRRSASAVAETLLHSRLSGVTVLETAGHPAVYGEKRISPDLPTLLVYGHHDVQPPGRMERWTTPPFEAVVRDGRIYGRGTADDKGGFLACLAAAEAAMVAGTLRCNLKFLIEGEEEVGSPHLPGLLEGHRHRFDCDSIILCDTPNFATGVPALTYRLRGNCIVDVEVRCLNRPVHSGQGGGLVPDATMILCALLSRLTAGDGTLSIPGLDEMIAVDEDQAASLRSLPFDSARIRSDLGVLPAVALAGNSWESVWGRPSLSVTAIESVPMERAANQIADAARARLSLRTVRNIDTRTAGELLVRALQAGVPFGAQVEARVIGGPDWWEADPGHPVYAVARRALSRAFGSEAVLIGSGGSIGFVKPFAELSPHVPPILTGVQDPHSNAHSENESLGLEDWQKAMAGALYLFDELHSFHRETKS